MSRQPEVLWAQRSDKMYLTVSLQDTKDVSMKTEVEGLFDFSATGPYSEVFTFTLYLYGSIVPELSVSMCIGESSMKTPSFEANTTLKNTEDQSEELGDESSKSYSSVESTNEKLEIEVPLAEDKDLSPKRDAKIHDFCLGILFGGIMLGGGLIGFIFSRNVASLATGGLLGGAILAMGVISLKVWRQGLFSLPFMLGQAALTATLLWKHLQAYSLMKKILPSGFYIAMRGNPPPKKKFAASSTSKITML